MCIEQLCQRRIQPFLNQGNRSTNKETGKEFVQPFWSARKHALRPQRVNNAELLTKQAGSRGSCRTISNPPQNYTTHAINLSDLEGKSRLPARGSSSNSKIPANAKLHGKCFQGYLDRGKVEVNRPFQGKTSFSVQTCSGYFRRYYE